MNEDFVSYELAVMFKACGFDEPCDSYYSENGKIAVTEDPECFNCNKNLPIYSRVPLWQAAKWLRERKGYVVAMHPEGEFLKTERIYRHTGWNYSIICIGKNGIMTPGPIGKVLMAKYEQALAKGIAHALELIRKGV